MPQLSVATQLGELGPDARTRRRFSPAEAADYCQRLARRHYENFTVASRLLPRRLVPHFTAIYAYCRWADDLADETGDCQRSLELLDWWQRELERCYAGEAEHPVFVALAGTIREFDIPREPFCDLLDAFRQDQTTSGYQTTFRYQTHQEVLDYCRRSANPVGRLILHLGRCHEPVRAALSDAVCTGLQLVNFCQDVARDWRIGRVYLPADTLAWAGCDEAMLARGEPNAALARAVEREVERAEGYLRRGQKLVPLMPRELRLDVALFAAGGLAIARAIRRAGCDVWSRRPTLSKWTHLRLLAGCWWSLRSNPSPAAKGL